MKSIKSKLIIDGTGAAPIKNGVILIDEDKITQIGTQGSVEIPEDTKIIDLGDQVVLPGLIDPHRHLGPMDGRVFSEKTKDPDAYKALWASRTMREDLKRGTTTMRLLGQGGDGW